MNINCKRRTISESRALHTMTSQAIDLTDESDELAHLDLSFTHPRLNGTITPFASTDGPSMHIIRGTWKFDRGTTLPFELKQTVTHASKSSIDGIYRGKFSMMQNDGGKSIKEIREDRVEIVCTRKNRDKYEVRGNGNNKYGSFMLVGVASKKSSEEYTVDMFKIYAYMSDYSKFQQQIKQESAEGDHGAKIASYQHTINGHSNDKRMTRVDGKGLWRSWKRNFNSQLTAILDLVDNCMDASISEQSDFIGRCHINPDTRNSTITGITIMNNCIFEPQPLKKCLEVYDSSKVHSGADHVGENGVGLKQACATLSNCSFVLVKRRNDLCELGIIAESLQSTEGVFLPAFQFPIGDTHPSLEQQMKSVFTQSKYVQEALTIEKYGAVSKVRNSSLEAGIKRLSKHFDQMCNSEHFKDSPYVFAVIVDKVRSDNVDAMPKHRVNDLLDELTQKISWTYLHVPRSCVLRINNRIIDYTYWQRRLVEFSKFTIDVDSTVEWKEWVAPREDRVKCKFRVYLGFDSQVMIDRDESKLGALYVYSRQSGRLITHYRDARTMLSLRAGGSEFCSGLRIILDDSEGHLPLNPTKQDVAFSEKAHGEIFKENLYRSIGAVVHMYYNFHIKKYSGKKTILSKKVTEYGEKMATEYKLDKELANLDLTTFDHSEFKVNRGMGTLRLEVVEENVGSDTLYRLDKCEQRKKTAPKKLGKKRKNDDIVQKEPPSPRRLPYRRNRMQQSYHENDSEPDPIDYSDEGGLFSSTDDDKDPADDDKDPEATVIPFLPRFEPLRAHAKKPRGHSQSNQLSKSRLAGTTTDLFGDDNEDEGGFSTEAKLLRKNELLKDLTARYDERNKALIEREKIITELRSQNNVLVRTMAEKDQEILELKEQLSHIISYERNASRI